MADRTFTRSEAVAAYEQASNYFLGALRTVDDEQWDHPGLGEWNVRELVAHAVRAFRTVDQYLDGTVRDSTPLTSAAEYFRMVLAEDEPHIHIAVRARREAPDLGDDPIAVAEALAEQALRTADQTPADAVAHTFVGVIPLPDYLATRVVELVVHTLDLVAALGLDMAVPPLPGRVAVHVLTDLVHDENLGDVLLALTGRTDLLVGVNALA